MDVDFANGEYSFFPYMVKRQSDEIRSSNRLAWGEGDLNEVLLFYRAGALLNDAGLIQLANLIGAQSIMRKEERSTMVADASFSHGASGLAQYYKILYRESKVAFYLEGHTHWIEQTILLLDNDLQQGIYHGKEHNFADGLVGIAFTLLSYISDTEFRWSRSVLL